MEMISKVAEVTASDEEIITQIVYASAPYSKVELTVAAKGEIRPVITHHGPSEKLLETVLATVEALVLCHAEIEKRRSYGEL